MGEWQKSFVNFIVELSISHEIAFMIMGKVCDIRQVAYMEGYNKCWDDISNKNQTVIKQESTLLNPNDIQWGRKETRTLHKKERIINEN